MLPSNTAYVQGQGVASADNLNSLVQWCASVSQLRTFVGLPTMQVALQGSVTPGDGLGGNFYWNANATATDDGVTVIRPSAVTVGAWLRLSYYGSTSGHGVAYVDDFGAVPNNLTFDSYSAFVAALASGAGTVILSSGGYRSSAGIVVPDGVTLKGVNFQPGNPPSGSMIVFDLAVATCVALSGGDNGTAAVENFTISRAAGAVPVNSIGLLNNCGYNLRAENMMFYRHYIGAKWVVSGGNGLGSMNRGLYSGVISGYHLLFDTWPEARFQQCRLGMDGSGDVAALAYIGITGGGTGGQGPNTLIFENCQFNCGSLPGPQYGIQFFNNANTGSNCLEFKFTDCHWETFSSAWMTSDATTIQINRMSLVSCTVNEPALPAFALDAATAFAETAFVGGQYFTSTFSLGPEQFVGLSLTAVTLTGAGSFNAVANSTLALANNNWGNGLTVAGAGRIGIFGDRLIGGVFTNNATDKVVVQSPDFSGVRSFTPTLPIGGATTGITYGTQLGAYEYLSWDLLRIDFNIVLTNKGALTGAVTVGNLPVSTDAFWGAAAAGSMANFVDTASLTGPIYVSGVAGQPSLAVIQGDSTGTTPITNANLTNTTGLQGSIIVKV